MLFQQYADPDAFRDQVLPFLRQREVLHNLPLGLVGSLEQRMDDSRGCLLGVVRDDQGQVQLVVIRIPPSHMVLAGHTRQLKGAIETAVSFLTKTQSTIPGVIGPADAVQVFFGPWSEATGSQAVASMKQRLYRLDTVREVAHSPGVLRKVEPLEVELAAQWLEAFSHEAHGDDGFSPAQARKRAEILVGQERLHFWDVEGPVSMAARSRQTGNGIVINSVYTPPEHRGNGYATSCVAALSQLLLDQGFRFCMLGADVTNPISNRIFRIARLATEP